MQLFRLTVKYLFWQKNFELSEGDEQEDKKSAKYYFRKDAVRYEVSRSLKLSDGGRETIKSRMTSL